MSTNTLSTALNAILKEQATTTGRLKWRRNLSGQLPSERIGYFPRGKRRYSGCRFHHRYTTCKSSILPFSI